jgi:hypothetical protein
VLAFSASAIFAADMFTGTWKMNIAKSTSSTATTNTTQIVTLGNGIRLVGDSVNSAGIKSRLEFTAQFDSKEYPFNQMVDGKLITDGNDKVSAKKIDDYTVEVTRKRHDNVLAVIKMVVSKDGKTMTSTVNGTDAQGDPFSSTTIFEKQ